MYAIDGSKHVKLDKAYVIEGSKYIKLSGVYVVEDGKYVKLWQDSINNSRVVGMFYHYPGSASSLYKHFVFGKSIDAAVSDWTATTPAVLSNIGTNDGFTLGNKYIFRNGAGKLYYFTDNDTTPTHVSPTHMTNISNAQRLVGRLDDETLLLYGTTGTSSGGSSGSGSVSYYHWYTLKEDFTGTYEALGQTSSSSSNSSSGTSFDNNSYVCPEIFNGKVYMLHIHKTGGASSYGSGWSGDWSLRNITDNAVVVSKFHSASGSGNEDSYYYEKMLSISGDLLIFINNNVYRYKAGDTSVTKLTSSFPTHVSIIKTSENTFVAGNSGYSPTVYSYKYENGVLTQLGSVSLGVALNVSTFGGTSQMDRVVIKDGMLVCVYMYKTTDEYKVYAAYSKNNGLTWTINDLGKLVPSITAMTYTGANLYLLAGDVL